MRIYLYTFVAVFMIMSCGGSSQQNGNVREQVPVVPLAKHSIIEENKNEAVSKCNVHVSLDSEITEQQIKDIANKIHESRTDYKKLYIFYYLPKMKVGSGCWATSHFLPDMKVEFTGFMP